MVQKAAPILEAHFLEQVIELAQRRGWDYLHLVRAPYKDHWRTPFRGSLGKGFPDLMLCRRERLLFLELKRQGEKATPDQIRVLGILGGAAETMLVWPNDWDLIEQVLR